MREPTSLELYFKDVDKYPLLTREEEKDYASKSKAGDKDAYNKLVTSNLRFVVKIAKHYQNKGLPPEDLISEGNLGLMRAAETFEIDKGYRFISYAVWWIRQKILLALDYQPKMIRLPLNKLQTVQKFNKIIYSDLEEDEKVTEISNLAKKLNLGESIAFDLINISREVVSLDTPIYSAKKDPPPIVDFIEDNNYKSTEEIITTKIMGREINSHLEKFLTPVEKEVVESHFGLNGKQNYTLEEIGVKKGLTKERIRQIEASAFRKLKKSNSKKRLFNYLINDSK